MASYPSFSSVVEHAPANRSRRALFPVHRASLKQEDTVGKVLFSHLFLGTGALYATCAGPGRMIHAHVKHFGMAVLAVTSAVIGHAPTIRTDLGLEGNGYIPNIHRARR
jgi:hypothetical protein